jgi:hypothetical protein
VGSVTTRSLLRLISRRWYVVVIVLTLTGLLYVTLTRAGSAYSTEAQVVFVAPGDVALAPFNDQRRETLVSFAAAIESELNNGRPSDRLAEGASLFGAGINQGYQVLLPNAGGQWQYSFPDPALTIRVVGPNPQWVTSTTDRLLTRVNSLVAERQHSSGVPSAETIHTAQVPDEIAVNYIGASTGARARALGSLLLVGLGLSAYLAAAVDRLSQKVHAQ